MTSTLLAFCGAALVLAMIPGPSTAVIVRQALRGGRRAALATIAANEVGLLFWALVAALGATALVEASEVAYDALRLAGAAVLVVLGVQSILGRPRAGGGELGSGAREPAAGGGWSAFRVGLLTILANPKAAVFAASFLPQFVPTGAPALPALPFLALVWVAVDTAWYLALVLLLGRLQAAMAGGRVRRTLEAISGGVLVALGARMVLERP
ncbi:threonine transporter RhtB [Sorangium cellulosum]|uniref:Threonine transporter RhtB n=1 Tax=Sorangium cellulosum TaxID=56 RepID=A0A4V0ND91_SORCE|nr:LysE family translocator [Sorangium cellulosum]AUX21852.1 threonine transporter RhtB [Sorangium cellulosum]